MPSFVVTPIQANFNARFNLFKCGVSNERIKCSSLIKRHQSVQVILESLLFKLNRCWKLALAVINVNDLFTVDVIIDVFGLIYRHCVNSDRMIVQSFPFYIKKSQNNQIKQVKTYQIKYPVSH